jgi:hypothetical protein
MLTYRNCVEFDHIHTVIAFKYAGKTYTPYYKINFNAINKHQTMGGIHVSSLLEGIGRFKRRLLLRHCVYDIRPGCKSSQGGQLLRALS